MSNAPILPDDDLPSLPSERTMRGGDPAALGRIDHYDLLRKLGGGGFGVVYLARDSVSGIDVALKTLHPLLKHNAEEMDLLREKFALVSRLAHPNIATALVLHRVRDLDIRDDGVRHELNLSPGDSVMVMRYAPGVTLSKWRRQFPDGIVPPELALEIGRQLAAALDYAHGERIVHRDIKPSNVMVETVAAEPRPLDHGQGAARRSGAPQASVYSVCSVVSTIRVRILDFGLAAEIRSSMSRVSTERGDTSGTRPYMAPEQWLGRKQDGRTDQYALACVLYELLSGAPPFAGVFETGDPAIMERAVLGREPDEIEGVVPAANAALRRALAKDPKDRFPSCTAFVAALSSTTEHTDGTESSPGHPPAGRAVSASRPESLRTEKTVSPVKSDSSKRRFPPVAGVLVVAALVVLFLLLRSAINQPIPDEPAPQPIATPADSKGAGTVRPTPEPLAPQPIATPADSHGAETVQPAPEPPAPQPVATPAETSGSQTKEEKAPAPEPSPDEPIAVRINGKPAITVAELDEMTDGIFRQYGQQIPSEMADRTRADIRKRAMQNLIDQRILVAEAAKLGVTLSDAEKLAALSEMTDGITDIETAALASGTTPEKFNRMFSESLLASKLVSLQTNGIAEPTDEEVKARFKEIVKEHPEAMHMSDQVTASHILVLVDKNAPAEEDAAALAKIRNIRKRALAGEDFGALAKEFSEDPGSKDKGGEYTFGRGRMVPEFEKAAFEQEIGVIGEPVRTSYGYHILKVSQRTLEHDVTFEEVAETIKEGLHREAVSEKVQAYVKGLRDDAKIEVVEGTK